jgi:hypothetical protein
MAVETATQKNLCSACGAEVRPGAMFCYSCGSAVTATDDLSGNGQAKIEKENVENQPAELPIAKPDEKVENGKPFKKPVDESPALKNEKIRFEEAEPKNKKLIVEKERTLKTAASVRKQAKPQTKAVEVSWEEEDSPNILFIAAALVLTLLAVGALLAMLYLK